MESLTLTRVRDGLTPEQVAAVARDRKPSSHGQWSSTQLLLATVADRLAVQTMVIARVNGAKWPAPEPIPRPGVDAARSGPVTTVEQLKARTDPATWEIAERIRRGETVE